MTCGTVTRTFGCYNIWVVGYVAFVGTGKKNIAKITSFKVSIGVITAKLLPLYIGCTGVLCHRRLGRRRQKKCGTINIKYDNIMLWVLSLSESSWRSRNICDTVFDIILLNANLLLKYLRDADVLRKYVIQCM